MESKLDFGKVGCSSEDWGELGSEAPKVPVKPFTLPQPKSLEEAMDISTPNEKPQTCY